MFDAIIGFLIFIIIGSVIRNLANSAGTNQQPRKNLPKDPREVFKDFIDQSRPLPQADTFSTQEKFEYSMEGHSLELQEDNQSELYVNTVLTDTGKQKTINFREEPEPVIDIPIIPDRKKRNTLTFTRDTIRDGIILSEILQPPKSRRGIKVR